MRFEFIILTIQQNNKAFTIIPNNNNAINIFHEF
jgi:hypothetical protein